MFTSVAIQTVHFIFFISKQNKDDILLSTLHFFIYAKGKMDDDKKSICIQMLMTDNSAAPTWQHIILARKPL